MTPEEISKLRKLAKDAIDRSDRWHLGRGDGIEQSQATALARGLLSALDKLGAANKKLAVRDQDLEAAIKVIWKWHRKKQAAEASRDQAIKERDELLRELNDAIAKHQQRWELHKILREVVALAGISQPTSIRTMVEGRDE